MDKVVEVVLANEVLRDVGELDLDVLGVVERGCEVVVGDVVGDELCTFRGDHAVEKKFTEVERGGFSPGVTVVHAVFTHDGDARAVWILFFEAEFAHY